MFWVLYVCLYFFGFFVENNWIFFVVGVVVVILVGR